MNTIRNAIEQSAHKSWHHILLSSLEKVKPHFLHSLLEQDDWLPGIKDCFNAFSLPLRETRFIFFGESPYPRKNSANGYAFWDAAVGSIWSENGLSKQVNRATSLRNFIKMLLVANDDLSPHNCRQAAIADVNKSNLISNIDDLFNHLIQQGFLLLNASLTLSPHYSVSKQGRLWMPFIEELIKQIHAYPIQAILLGNIAKKLAPVLEKYQLNVQLTAEHPYNVSFIKNIEVLNFFQPFNLLNKHGTL